ncbi:asparaginase [Streptomyces hirsutus]|uniref:asparaginase n=1 Tax=Streptomyces TaxID=1883 RepID=UPI0038643392|nr:asparaginase [Streptomyces hirsutus]WTD22268.1 asparaginase [Streptomyces hirsutus]WTD72663.1 asparaginase [Streptomyces sp. NBC_01635]WTD79486.1 asparaginase [Streptomyces sp. NBC_01635]
MRRIQVVATGGTIASRAGAEGRRATVLAKELLASVGPLPADAEVSARDVLTRGSYAFDTADLLALAREVRGALREGADAVVMTHGTDTMEETAFLFDLAFGDPRPIVLTGAQRPFDDRAADGPANLGDALAVAAADAARGHGPLLVFDGFAFPARGVRKSDTMSAHAFTVPGRGPALRVTDRLVTPLWRPSPSPRFPLDLDLPRLPRVDVVPVYPGADGLFIRSSLAAGAAGVVVEAVGAGNAGPELVEAVAEAVAAGHPVLICSRVHSGPVAPLYAGGGAELQRVGAVFAGDLSPWQARLLLAVASAVPGRSPEALVRAWLAGDDPLSGSGA